MRHWWYGRAKEGPAEGNGSWLAFAAERWLSDRVWAHSWAHWTRCQRVPIRHTLWYLREVKYFDWDNAKLRSERGIGFEEIVFHIERGDLLDILEHPNPERYGGQRIFVVRREDYVYLVPFVEDEHTVFLKTIIPSRKATKEYLGEESDHED
jgi:hypothetical protein